MTSVLILLGAMLCSLTVSSEVLPQADFNVEGMAGKWYLVGFATNAQWFIRRKDSMKMGTAMLQPTADGDLDMSYASLNSDGTCWRMNNLAKKTDVSGKFTYISHRWGNKNDMTITTVKYDEYALAFTIKTKEEETTTVTKLYGRTEDLSADVMEKFRLVSLDAGILPENIVFLPKNGECPSA
ncbi:lipocalin [Melanotaenia boesemani]|uniref:lipocalin n=1 Tax=Melanotaenia boesemani TaxID=1250792 RepID=UPI001C056F5E|nr:lipocalin [Melanotaenia boesemani]